MNEKEDVLSQDEIDDLLGKMGDAWEMEKMPGNRVLSQPQIDKIFNVKPCDLGRADVFTNPQKQAVSLMFEKLACRMTTWFSANLRQLCHFHVSSVDELTYEEFIRSIPTPTLISSANFGSEKIAIQIDPCISIELLYNNIIQLLYEKCDPDSNDEKTAELVSDFLHDLRVGAHRGYRENEIATLEQTVIRPILGMLVKAFMDYEDELNLCPELVAKYPHGIKPKDVKLLQASIINTQNNPQFVQIVSPNEIIILICIETKIGDEEGFINICLPRPFVENVLIASGLLFGNSPQNNSAFQKGSKGSGYACLGNFNLKDNDQLEKGSVIVLDRLCGEYVTLHDSVSGKIIANAEVVKVDDNYGVRLTEVVEGTSKINGRIDI
ncbi:MAG: FliM/FliN family flagellar motor switch protein [Treponema sp.]|nr:FliM/FliN family flagellar motor switch protein [Treponema sp.]MBO6219613.1 FliM/FliN family flagellar motor switch protein [Treponema sp.]